MRGLNLRREFHCTTCLRGALRPSVRNLDPHAMS